MYHRQGDAGNIENISRYWQMIKLLRRREYAKCGTVGESGQKAELEEIVYNKRNWNRECVISEVGGESV